MEYKQVGVPKTLWTAFLKIQPILGYRSFSEFVVEAIRGHLTSKEYEADRRMENIRKKYYEAELLESPTSTF